MKDEEIVRLYWQRDEAALTATQEKYGGFCRGIARNILGSEQDAQECWNDLLSRAWASIPPQRPQRLQVWLGRVVRNLALDRWRQAGAQKRGADGGNAKGRHTHGHNAPQDAAGMPQLLEELAACVPDPHTPETSLENSELARCLDGWLRGLPRWERCLFIRRYWNGEPLQALAAQTGLTPSQLAQRMYQLRASLRAALEKEDIFL